MRRFFLCWLVWLYGLVMPGVGVRAQPHPPLSEADQRLMRRRLDKQKRRGPRWFYNKGTLAVMEKNWDEAIETLNQALLSDDPVLQQKTHYNLAHAYAFKAQALYRTNPQAALTTLDRAVYHVRRALELDPDDREARENLRVLEAIRRRWLEAQRREQNKQAMKQRHGSSTEQQTRRAKGIGSDERPAEASKSSAAHEQARSAEQNAKDGRANTARQKTGPSQSALDRSHNQQGGASQRQSAGSREETLTPRDRNGAPKAHNGSAGRPTHPTPDGQTGENETRPGTSSASQRRGRPRLQSPSPSNRVRRASSEEDGGEKSGPWRMRQSEAPRPIDPRTGGLSQTERKGLNPNEAEILMKRYLSEKGDNGWLWFVVPRRMKAAPVRKDW